MGTPWTAVTTSKCTVSYLFRPRSLKFLADQGIDMFVEDRSLGFSTVDRQCISKATFSRCCQAGQYLQYFFRIFNILHSSYSKKRSLTRYVVEQPGFDVRRRLILWGVCQALHGSCLKPKETIQFMALADRFKHYVVLTSIYLPLLAFLFESRQGTFYTT